MNQESLKKKYGFQNPFKPDSLSKKVLRYVNSGRKLLDSGCGEGADSVFFARRGFNVTALENNKDYLKPLRAFRKGEGLKSISIFERDIITYRYPPKSYDVILSFLVICCMKRSEFETMLQPMKDAVKPGGIIVMSSRNYLDPELNDYYSASEKMIEPNTFRNKDTCCKFAYFIEKNRLREVFSDFDILYYYEGCVPCKYDEHVMHGESHIICRLMKKSSFRC